MKGQFKKLSIGLFISFFISTAVLPKAEDNQQEVTVKKPTVLDVVETNIKRIKDLDYFDSTQLSLLLPTGNEFVIDWGFVGAGNILSCLSSIYPTLQSTKDTKVADATNEEANKFSLTDLAKIYAKNKLKAVVVDQLKDYQQYLPGFGWLLESELTPLRIFALKLFLLLNHKFPEGQEIRRKVEILRLLFRLSQSKFSNVLDKEKSIYSYLPEELRKVLETNLSYDWRKFIDDMWHGLGKGFVDYEFADDGSYDVAKEGIACRGYVFDDLNLAKSCLQELKDKQNLSALDFEQVVDAFVKNKKHEIVEHSDFVKWSNNSYYKFVGYRNFGRLTKDSAVNSEVANYLTEEIKQEVLKDKNVAGVLLIPVSPKEIWLVHATNKLSVFDGVKLSFASFVKAVDEYKQIKDKQDVSADKKEKDEPVFSEKEAELLEELDGRKDELENKVTELESSAKEAAKEVNKYKNSSDGSKLNKTLLALAKEKHEKFSFQLTTYKKELVEVVKQLNILRKNPYGAIYNALTKDGAQSIENKGIVNLVADVLINSPELSQLLEAINSDDSCYAKLRKNLFNRLRHVLANTQNVKSNLEIYRYLVDTLLPAFSGSFKEMTKDIEETQNPFVDSVFSSLGLA